MAIDQPNVKAREPGVARISIDEAIELLSCQATNRLIQVRRDGPNRNRMINIIAHE